MNHPLRKECAALSFDTTHVLYYIDEIFSLKVKVTIGFYKKSLWTINKPHFLLTWAEKLIWAPLITCCPLFISRLSHFLLLLQNNLANFNQTLYNSSLKRIHFCSNEGKHPPKGDTCNSKWIEIPEQFLAHLSWKLKWAILIARCPSSVCPSVRPSVNFYIFDFFSRTTGPILTKLGTNHPWGEGILNC
jgi:hypothetical protein